MDSITQKRINKLHPIIREEAQKIITECYVALTGRAKVRIRQSLRTFLEQEQLYTIGRTKPGRIVTNAKPGQSINNYGLAVDICLVIDGKTANWDVEIDWDNYKVSDWYECVKIFAKYGWDWGGNWKKFKDLPHFEKKSIKRKTSEIKTTWRNLIKLPKDKDGYVIF